MQAETNDDLVGAVKAMCESKNCKFIGIRFTQPCDKFEAETAVLMFSVSGTKVKCGVAVTAPTFMGFIDSLAREVDRQISEVTAMKAQLFKRSRLASLSALAVHALLLLVCRVEYTEPDPQPEPAPRPETCLRGAATNENVNVWAVQSDYAMYVVDGSGKRRTVHYK